MNGSNQMNKEFIYYPSFSAGAYGNAIKNDLIMENGMTCRFYDNRFNSEFRHPFFLWPAAHFKNQSNLKEKFGFDDSISLFGDSGGYQVASGVLKWNPELKLQILNWLEENSNIAMNLDIPPRLTYEGKMDECMEISHANIKYFYENRQGKTKFLNVIQGNDEHSYLGWYQKMKDFQFEGWSIGGAGGSLYRFMSGIMAFLSENEHLKPHNEYFHVLGTSKISDFFILSQLQKSLNDVGSPVQLTTDSSSPNRATSFGTIYIGYDLKRMNFKSIHYPKHTIEHGKDKSNFSTKELVKSNDYKLPELNQFTKWLKECYNYDDIKNWTSLGYVTAVLHNFSIFKSAISDINYYVQGEPYILEQIIDSDMQRILNIVDLMVKSGNSIDIFNKNKEYIKSIGSKIDDEVKLSAFKTNLF